MKRALRWTGLTGIAAGALYVATTASGSWLDPGYSQVAYHVSDLTATGAPTRGGLIAPYLLYNLLGVAFAVALYITSDRERWFKLGTTLLIVNAFAGVMMVTLFAEDPGGVPRTFTGQGHVAMAGVSSIVIVAASVVYGIAFRGQRLWRPVSAYSFLTAVAFLIVAPVAILTTAANTYAGLAERAAIAPYILWLVVIGGHALLQSRQHREPGRRKGLDANITGSVVIRLMGIDKVEHTADSR